MSSTRPPARPASSSPAKGIVVVAVAIVLGVVILWRVPRSGGSGSTSRTTTTTSTSTTVPASTTSAPSVSMTGVKVLVVNAAGVAGAASAVTTQLKNAGLETLPPGNASQTGANQSSVYYADGYQPQANQVAKLLGLPAAVGAIDPSQIKGGPQGAQVVVMLGKDLASSSSATSAAGGTATTKAATATTKAATSTTHKATTTTHKATTTTKG